MCNDEINTRSRTLMKNLSNVIFYAENKTPANTKIILKSIYIIRVAEQWESLCSQAKILNLHLFAFNFKKYQRKYIVKSYKLHATTSSKARLLNNIF